MKLNIASNHPKNILLLQNFFQQLLYVLQKGFFSDGIHFEKHCLTAARRNRRQPDGAVPILEHGQRQAQAVAAHHAVPFKHTNAAPGIALFEITACL